MQKAPTTASSPGPPRPAPTAPATTSLIEDNWLHAFTTQAGNGHVDGYQTEGAKHGTIRHNTIDVERGPNRRHLHLERPQNLRRHPRGPTTCSPAAASPSTPRTTSPTEAAPAGGYAVTNIRFTDNRFSTVHYGCVGQWGVWYTRGNPTDQWNRTGNTVLETAANLDTGNPSYNGERCR